MGDNFNLSPHDVIFSLDIGTRSVVGILAKMEGSIYRVIDYEIVEHPERAMYDGQIHDIDKVTDVVKRVKEALEERNKIELKYVSIAAAGRSLKTHKVFIENEIDPLKEVNKSLINSIEIEGIQLAQREMEELNNQEDTKYYCVGYSVINYYLDGNIIGNLKGHRGNKIGAEILATFLPHVVVDSLYTVVHNLELEVINLTLEPIAAINIAIPEKFRLLNLALIDIGAGTSDIAITKEGVITSYSMVSVAGDEVTEAISKRYLMDFVSAEKLKISLNKKETHSFRDIVGISYEATTEEIISNIQETIDDLSKEIVNKIIECNGKAPSAVFLIGGGSQVPGLMESIARVLNLPKERVVIRGAEALENIGFVGNELIGPEFVTPLGIGFTAFKDKEQDFLQVTVNGKTIRLFNSRRLTVSDALIIIGFNARQLLPQRGKPLTYILNGNKRIIHGGYGEPAQILVNNLPASLETKLNDKDTILIEPASQGERAKAIIKDILDKVSVTVNNKEIDIIKDIRVNGKNVNLDYKIQDDDRVEIKHFETIKELFDDINLEQEYDILLNGEKVTSNHAIKTGDNIQYRKKEKDLNIEEKTSKITLEVNGKKVTLNKPSEKKLIFVDLFNYIDFDLKEGKGLITLKLNGKDASYTDELKNNDIIEIYWR